jgi:Integrase core domain
MGIRDRPTSPRPPWQTGYAERLIGSIRRECLDHVVVLSERHLRHLLLSYMKYYNGARTHLSREKDAPVSRTADRAGHILCRPTRGGRITNMPGFNLRQAQVIRQKRQNLKAQPVDHFCKKYMMAATVTTSDAIECQDDSSLKARMAEINQKRTWLVIGDRGSCS